MSNYLNSCNEPAENGYADKIRSIQFVRSEPHNGTLKRILTIWFQRWQQRRKLENLPPHLLKDIGISRTAAEHEAAKPFWVE